MSFKHLIEDDLICDRCGHDLEKDEEGMGYLNVISYSGTPYGFLCGDCVSPAYKKGYEAWDR